MFVFDEGIYHKDNEKWSDSACIFNTDLTGDAREKKKKSEGCNQIQGLSRRVSVSDDKFHENFGRIQIILSSLSPRILVSRSMK